MTLIRWTPFNQIDDFFGPLMPGALANLQRLALGDGKKLDWAPSADISETDKEYLIRAELPSVKREDIQVTLEEGTITLKGERKQQREDKNEQFHHTENFYGSFERRFSLPKNINAEAVRCESKDGILTVHIPKSEAPKNVPKHIAVQ